MLDVSLADADAERLIEEWARAARLMLDAVGWPDEKLFHRRFPGGASLGFSAPLDALYTATEVNEWAWAAAVSALKGERGPAFESNAALLREKIQQEQNPALLRIQHAANQRGLIFLSDEDMVSVGVGTGSRSWPTENLPDVTAIDWSQLHNRPIALVTGGNGKTTTTRLVAAMGQAAGLVTGSTSTDGIQVAGGAIEPGDFAGPGGARQLLRHPDVELAVLETARGGILRRGLAVTRANAAIITNIADDHLGEFGITDIESLTSAKLVVTRALGPECPLVLNADDPALVAGAGTVGVPIIWFSLDAGNPVVRNHVASGGTAVVLDGANLLLAEGTRLTSIVSVPDVPITLGGAARYNIANALGAIGLGHALKLPIEAMAGALRTFEGSRRDNPGRLNRYDLGGAVIVVDFAHNPHGLSALVDMAAKLTATRTLVLLGQAGDRDDEAIRELARIAWRIRPNRVIAKEMADYARGRPSGEISGLIESELLTLGAPAQAIEKAPTELEAVHRALTWSRPGDLLLLTVHSQRGEVLELLDGLHTRGWVPGHPTR